MMNKKTTENGSKTESTITYPKGFKASGITCGLKASGASDLALIVGDEICDVAGVFTTSKMPGAPVIVSKKHIKSGKVKAVVCNSGVANVCTGVQGVEDALNMCSIVAEGIRCSGSDVLVCSTGVIGPRVNMDKIEAGIGKAIKKLKKGKAADIAAGTAILTTDLTAKGSKTRIAIGDTGVRIGGIAKGSGMIQPNMATMLSFITTDANIDAKLLKTALKSAVDDSFNRISVDHETSTSDSVIIMASAAAGNRKITSTGKAYDTFYAGLIKVCKELAYAIVKDGEGATKVYRVAVTGAKTLKDADKVGKTVVGSPLVKTAIFGSDPNWGRIVMAVGRSQASVKPTKLRIAIGGIDVCVAGEPVQQSEAKLKQLNKVMAEKEILITIDLGLGKGAAEWLGCDLSYKYVEINAEYTT